jgi:DNA ligase-1
MKPMKAYSKTPTLSELKYPVMASPKLDGIRCIIDDGKALSNQLKLIPNKHVQAWAKEYSAELQGFDGELMVIGDFNAVQSGIMAVNGSADFTFNAFDLWDEISWTFDDRLEMLKVLAPAIPRVVLVSQVKIGTEDALKVFWDSCIHLGYEGAIVRDPAGKYKYGRSTLREGIMIKLKKWDDSEAEITGWEELETNTNEAFIGELGQTKRSHEKAGMVAVGTLGALVVKWQGKTLNIGTGFNMAQRDELWAKRTKLVGQTVTFKYFGTSAGGIPRHPVYKGLRYDV